MKAVALIESNQIPDDADHSVELVDLIDAEDVTIESARAIEKNADWEEGKPCSECGSTQFSVMASEEDVYRSDRGEFSFEKKGEAFGPKLSIMCKNCETIHHHIPVKHLPYNG